MNRVLSLLEYTVILALGRVDVEYAARYLRNPAPLRSCAVLGAFGATMGVRSRIKGSLFLDNYCRSDGYAGDFSNLVVADNCYIGDGVYVDLASEVRLGHDVMVSARCAILTHQNAHRSPYISERFAPMLQPVYVGEGAWIGANATLLPGVSVGARAVVAAGAVVADDVRDETLVAGVPARQVRKI